MPASNRAGGIEDRRRCHVAKRVEIDTSAPDFALDDFTGRRVRLSDYRGQKHVVLVFNRGFF